MATTITSPDDPALADLCEQLRTLASELDTSAAWPAEQLRLCGEYGVYEWFIPPQHGGQGWSERDVTRGYLALSAACLTTTFILTQRTGACTRIASSENQRIKERLLPPLARGDSFASIGISHLTTSGRHLKQPLMRARREGRGYRLDGFSPWVTGACHAEHVVVGAVLIDGDAATEKQLLTVLPMDLRGVNTPEPAQLVGLTASHTGPVQTNATSVDESWLLAGPAANVMSVGAGGSTGGLQTSALAIGLSSAALNYLEREAIKRDELGDSLAALHGDLADVERSLFAAVDGQPGCSKEQLRTRANSLALRSTQAALAAAKGAGYVLGHPAGRWCREALFFLVWSCPQPVVAANLCELAGILD